MSNYPPFYVKRNKQGHTVVRLHYSADPDKNPETAAGKNWFDKMSGRYLGSTASLGWRREYEIDFKAGSGELVFPDFLNWDTVIDSFPIPDTYNLYGGLDWGSRNPVSFHVYAESPDQQFYSIWEYYEKGNQTNVFEVSKMMKHLCPYYDRLQWIAYDPSMNSENQQRKDGNISIIRMFQEEVAEADRVDKLMSASGRSDMLAIQFFKTLFISNRFKFFRECVRQIDEFTNLKYPERTERTNEPEKILDKDNHSWDEAKYFILSHPSAQIVKEKLKYGTIGYINKVSALANEIASQTGESIQTVFNRLNGTQID